MKRAPSIRRAWTSAAISAVGLSLVALALSTAAPAGADPTSTSGLVNVGADVTQDLWGAYTGAEPPAPRADTQYYTPLHSSSATNNVAVQSFEANPPGGTTLAPGCITTKFGGPSYDRPNSTTAGINALSAAVNGTGWQNSSASCTGTTVSVTGQIDFARAARGPKSSGSTLTFIPYARDAVGVLSYDHGTGNVASLTTAQLTALYSSSTGSITVGGDTVLACLTISGSTPRSNLEAATGVTDAQANTAANAAGCNNLEQNNGNAFYTFASGLPAGTDAVDPISSGQWLSQANGVAVDRGNLARAGGVDLVSIDALGKPYTGSGTNLVPSTTYYSSTQYGYNLNTVVPTNKITGFTKNAALVSLFVGSSSSLCSAASQATANRFGFDSLTAGEGTCGATTTTGNS